MPGDKPAALSQRDFNRITLVVLSVGLATLVALGVTIVWLSFKTRDYNQWVDHTYLAEQRVVAFQAAVEQAETTRRGYLLGPSPVQLEGYRTARSKVGAALYDLATTTQDNPVQRANIGRIRPLLAWKLKVNDDSVAAVKAGHQVEAIRHFPVEQAMQPLQGIRNVTAAMLEEERRLLKVRSRQESDSMGVLIAVGLATAALLAVLTTVSIIVMRRFAANLTEAQAELKVFNEALEQRVRDRTIDLTRANEEIQRFAYIVSHDLRSPLVNVMGFTSELEVALKPLRALVRWVEERDAENRMPAEIRTAVDMDIPESINFIRIATRKMDGLIGAILKLSREGRRVLHPERLPMRPLVDNILDTVRHQLDTVEASAVVEGDLPDLVSDRLAVEQVIGNLIDNAIKYRSPKRPLEIVVRGTAREGRIVYDIADNGRGIDAKDHERIFELFRRSGAQNQAGEGIGLAHVRALAHRLGGTVTCTSALDQGAVFSLSLPRVLLAEGPPL